MEIFLVASALANMVLGYWSLRFLRFPKGIVPAIRFRTTFGLWPREWSETERVMIVQDIVDGVLAKLASEFLLACQRQEYYLKGVRGEKSKLEVYHEVHWHGQQVGRAKARFWTAHSLARRFGLEVKKTAKEYTAA